MADKIVQVPGVGEVAFPDSMSDEEIALAIRQNILKEPQQQAAKPEYRGFGEEAVGLGETALTMGTGIVGQSVGGLAGIASGLAGGDAAGTVRNVSEAMTYQPRTDVGQRTLEGISKPFQAVEEGLTEIGGRVTEDPVGTVGRLGLPPAIGMTVPPRITQALSNQMSPEARAAVGTSARVLPEAVGVMGGARFLRPNVKPRAADPAASPGTASRTLADAQQAGYKFAPTEVTGGAPVGNAPRRTAYGFGGKSQARQDLSINNMKVTNRLAREAIDVPELSPAALRAARQEANKAYDNVASSVDRLELDLPFVREIESLRAQKNASFPDKLNRDIDSLVERFKKSANPSTQDTLALIAELRQKASKNIRNDSPEIEELGWAQRRAADAAEELIGRNLERAGKTDELAQFREARRRLARIHTVDDAMNVGGGEIDPRVIQRAYEKGAPLDGNLELIARTSARFQNQMKPITQVSDSASVNAVDFYGGVGAGTIGGMMSPELMALAVVPALARYGARKYGLSPQPQPPRPPFRGGMQGARGVGLFETLAQQEEEETRGLLGL